MLVVGELIGGSAYRIVRLIGKGGMGEVYEATHETLSRRVAVKTIRPELFGDPELAMRFRREAESAAALGHPNIVQVTDFIIEEGKSPVLVMELLEGRTLRELVISAQKLEPARAVFIALQVLAGLAAAHKAGIIHRDVKPANVFLQKTLAVRDHVKLLDFGVAKLAEKYFGSENPAASVTGPVTERGMVLGTRAYMAPEQERGKSVDARSDLYSVGATLYFALSGRKHRKTSLDPTAPMPLSQLEPDVPSPLGAVVDRALAHRPEDRYASAEAMAEALAVFSKTTAGFGKATFIPGRDRDRDRDRVTTDASSPTMTSASAGASSSSSTETAAPMTVRDARFDNDVIESAGKIVSSPPVAPPNPLETTVDDPEARRQMAGLEALTTAKVAATTAAMVEPVAPPPSSVVDPTGDTHEDLSQQAQNISPPRAPPLLVVVQQPPPPQVPSFSRERNEATVTIQRPKPPGPSVKLVLLVFVFVILLAATLFAARYLR